MYMVLLGISKLAGRRGSEITHIPAEPRHMLGLEEGSEIEWHSSDAELPQGKAFVKITKKVEV